MLVQTREGPDEAVLRRWLEEDAPDVLLAAADAVLEEVPGTREDGDGFRAAITAHHPAMRQFLVAAPEAAAAGVELPAPADELVRSLARRGVPVDVMMRSFEVGHAQIAARFAESLRSPRYGLDPTRRADLLELGTTRLFAYINTMTVLGLRAFSAERAQMDRQLESRREGYVTALLDGSVEQVEAERVLDYPVAATHVGYVAWVDDVADVSLIDDVTRALAARLEPQRHLTVAVGFRTVHGWFAVSGRGRHALRGLELPPGTGAAFGAEHRGLLGFRATHRQALEAQRVGRGLGRTGVVCYGDVAVAALASRDPEAARLFAEQELGPLLSEEEGLVQLQVTLKAYLASLGSPTTTGRRLGVHPNTVVKRIERIQDLLGVPLIDPSSLSLRVALELLPLVATTRRGGPTISGEPG